MYIHSDSYICDYALMIKARGNVDPKTLIRKT